VRVFACGSLPDGGPYLVMELVRGVDLQAGAGLPEGRLEASRASRILTACVRRWSRRIATAFSMAT
jgi:hypothetical protein